MKNPWPELSFWKTGEYQVVQERMDDVERDGLVLNPERKSIFAGLRHTSIQNTKAVLLGQDPYPDHSLATGLAYSIPQEVPKTRWPPTLNNIFKEYRADLGYPEPPNGGLIKWADQGVLLWNATPTYVHGKPHSYWEEWKPLTQEILEKASKQGIVVVLMGNSAQSYEKYIDPASVVIHTSHPSPLAYAGGRVPRNSFLGSKVFSRVNTELVSLGKEPINWRLDDAVSTGTQSKEEVGETRSPLGATKAVQYRGIGTHL